MISFDIALVLPLNTALSISSLSLYFFFFLSLSLSLYRKDIKFSLVPNLAVTDVSNEIRKQCGLHSAAPFNLKYLDVESKSHHHVLSMYICTVVCCIV